MYDDVKAAARRMIDIGLDPYDVYMICRDFMANDDSDGLLCYVATLEAVSYDMDLLQS